MKKILLHPIAALFFTIISIIFMISLQKTRQRSENVSQIAEQLKNQVNQLELEVKQAENSLNQDSLGLEQEKVIRNELLMKKEGEIIFQLPPVKPVGEVVVNQVETLTPAEAWKQLITE